MSEGVGRGQMSDRGNSKAVVVLQPCIQLQNSVWCCTKEADACLSSVVCHYTACGVLAVQTSCRPASGETICSPRMAIQKSRRIYVRPRTGPQSAHLWWPTVAKLQAASVPIA